MTSYHTSAAYQRFARKVRPMLAATLPAPCGRCGGAIMPGEKFDIGHIVPGPLTFDNVRVEHVSCNRSEGGRRGAAKQQRERSRETRHLAW